MVTRGHAFRTYDWDRAVGMVDKFMSAYDLPAVASLKEAP